MKSLMMFIILVVNMNADSEKLLNMFKEFSLQGKNILVEQTLLNGINALVDNKKIKIKKFDIDEKTNKIKIDMFLKGEDKNLLVNIDKFQWGITKDKKHIVFEDFDINMNIAWMQYIIDDISKRENGYIKIKNKPAISALLYTIKPNIKTTYKEFKKIPFALNEYPFNKRFLKIEKLKISKDMIVTDVWLKGSSKNLKINVDSYTIITEKKQKRIILKDIQFREFTKPWIRSIIDAHKNEIHLKYTDKLLEMLSR